MKFKTDSLDWALAHALAHGDTDIFPHSFEFKAIEAQWKANGGVREWLLKQNPSNWKIRPHRRCLAPKHRFGFRISTQLDPLDFLVFSALVHDLGKDIEKTRVPVSKQIVHSYRFASLKDGQLYDPAYGWNTFLAESKRLAATGQYEFVVVADIADFFPKLYSHPLENQIVACTSQRRSTAKAILGMLKQWNHTISYGVPVGPAASRLLSELALTIIDKALISKNSTYCRFSDDFHIFCSTSREAHERLAYLAQMLFEGLGLTLQQHKTRILPIQEFTRTLLSPKRQARARLSEQFTAIIAALGMTNPYKKIDYARLSPEKKAQVDALNLGQILEEQIQLGEDLDIVVTSFVLRRLAQLGRDQHAELVLGALDTLYPVFPDAVGYLASLSGLHGNRKRAIGRQLLFDNHVLFDIAPRLRVEKAKSLRIGFAKPRDVLLTHNATVGRVAILPDFGEEIILGTSVTYYRTRHDVILPEFLAFAMQGQVWQDQLRSVMEQTTRNQVSITKQVEFFLPIPPIDEQQEVVRRVAAAFALVDRGEARLDAATKRAEQIMQATFAKAFKGELVPTEAELAEQEGREYETAASLLDRIRRQRRERADVAEPRKRRRMAPPFPPRQRQARWFRSRQTDRA